MILCIGISGSGKSMLLRQLHEKGLLLIRDTSKEQPLAEVLKPPLKLSTAQTTTPTVGTDLVTLSRLSAKKKGGSFPTESVVVREVGGAMAPLWTSYVEPGKTKGILYVVDTSAPENIGNATVHLIEFLSQVNQAFSSIRVVFSKTDLLSSRSLIEMKSIMRLDHIISTTKNKIEFSPFNIYNHDTTDDIFDWCLSFCTEAAEKEEPF